MKPKETEIRRQIRRLLLRAPGTPILLDPAPVDTHCGKTWCRETHHEYSEDQDRLSSLPAPAEPRLSPLPEAPDCRPPVGSGYKPKETR